jgi:hypothetical protein
MHKHCKNLRRRSTVSDQVRSRSAPDSLTALVVTVIELPVRLPANVRSRIENQKIQIATDSDRFTDSPGRIGQNADQLGFSLRRIRIAFRAPECKCLDSARCHKPTRNPRRFDSRQFLNQACQAINRSIKWLASERRRRLGDTC